MFFREKTILLFFFVIVYLPGLSQEPCAFQLTGRVVNESGDGVAGALVMVSTAKDSTLTDENGTFIMKGICIGIITVTAKFPGYKKKVLQLTFDGNTIPTIQLTPDFTQLEEVVIEDKHLSTTHAQNFSVLSEKQLNESAGKSLGESLREIPGVNTIQTGPGIFKPVIHGVHSQRILILNYGIRQEGQQWGAEHAPEIDPFVASNIIVIKDASSIKYGTDALGGVVIVNPPELPDRNDIGGSAVTVLQSNGLSGTLSAMLEGGIKNHDGWGWRMQGTAKRAGDFNAPDYMLTNTGVSELNISAATGYHAKNFGIETFFSRFQTELGILKGTSIGGPEDLLNAMEREPPQYTSSFSYDIGAPRQEVSHSLLKVNGHVKTLRGDWRFQYGFQNNKRKEFDIRRGDLVNTPAIDLKLNTHTVEVEWESTQSERHNTCIGVTGMFQDNFNNPGTKVIPFIPNFASQSGGVFAITKLLLSSWTIDAGARYDFRHYSVSGRDFMNALYRASMNFQNVSATAGATVRLPKNQTLSLSLSSAWRPPHVSELYSSGTHQSAAAIEYGLLLNDSTTEVMSIEDVSFKTEKALKFVTTYSRTWRRLQVEATVYANYIFNYIYLKPTGVTVNSRGQYPYLFYTQTDAFFLGTDLSGIWSLSSRLKVIPRASLIRASDVRNDDFLMFIPSARYEVAMRYDEPTRFWFKDFLLELKAKYVSRQNRAPRVVTVREIMESDGNIFEDNSSNFDFMAAPDGYMLLNAATGFSYHRKKSRYDFRLVAENILNTSYREYTNRFRYYSDDLGRNFVFSVKCIF